MLVNSAKHCTAILLEAHRTEKKSMRNLRRASTRAKIISAVSIQCAQPNSFDLRCLIVSHYFVFAPSAKFFRTQLLIRRAAMFSVISTDSVSPRSTDVATLFNL